MSWTSILAIYLLFWVITAFVVMPFGVRTADELGVEKVRGQADSAPANFKPLKVMAITTLVSAAAFGLFYANYINGWIGPDDVNIFWQAASRVMRRSSQNLPFPQLVRDFCSFCCYIIAIARS